MENNTKQRIKELEDKIKYYQKAYYENEGIISDADFDKLWDELKTLDPTNPLFSAIGSDSGSELSSSIYTKVQHIMPMGSQEKAADPEQFMSWAEKHIYDEYLVEYKLDGASLELQYNKGLFIRAITRGNGEIGDDITQNALKMDGLVSKLNGEYTGAVRGEVIMKHSIHETLYNDKANCRNAANGLMKRKDGVGCENLTIICYDAYFPTNSPFNTEKEKVSWLSNNGFNTVPLVLCKTAKDVIDYRIEMIEKRPLLDYDIDGLVIKNNIIDMDDAYRARPDKQIAFKFSLEEAISVIRNVIWNENGATYTPVAEFDTVDLAGTKVSRASLANPNIIKELGLNIGSHVIVVKRGEIIPKIMKVVSGNLSNDLSCDQYPVKIPEVCSTCGTALKNEGTRLFCPNTKCSKRVLHQLEKWISVIDIRDFGKTLIRSLFDSGELKTISNIYSLTEDQLTRHFLTEESLEKDKISLGAKKVIVSIQKSRDMKLSTFIAGFDIEGIGETMVEKLEEAGFNTIEKLLGATEEQIASVYQFAAITAHTLVTGLKENNEEMMNLIKSGIIRIKAPVDELSAFSGKSFCFTGELFTMKRSEAESIVKELGGTVKSSVIKGLSYLVTNDTTSGSSKNKKAELLNIPVIDEKSFIKMIETAKLSS